MTKYLLTIFLLVLPAILPAQDLIISKDGNRIPCKIISEDSVRIYIAINYNDSPINTFIRRDEIKGYFYDYYSRKQKFQDSIEMNDPFTKCFSFGFLQGGGSLIGFDIEVLLGNIVGLQVGAGIVGYGGGLNIHLKPSVRSSCISFQYWHQGLEESYTQSLFGPSYIFRAKKIFTAQIGMGFALEKGPAWPSSKTQPQVMLIYSIGIYFPG